MKTKVYTEKVDVSVNENRSLELLPTEIPGALPVHHTVIAGSELSFPANCGYWHILILIGGKADFLYGGKVRSYGERATFVPALDGDLTVKAVTDTQILEIRWDVTDEDLKLLEEYKTEFPVNVLYKESIQYIDPNKSEKTISRMMIPQRIIPRFSLGSVESYGYDLVKSHSHPMLDQFFFSFPENDMEVLINGEPINMLGNIIMHIPLGADHGVEVTGDRHLHYMWIDFMSDNAAGLKRLDDRHHPTGLWRDFDKERNK